MGWYETAEAYQPVPRLQLGTLLQSAFCNDPGAAFGESRTPKLLPRSEIRPADSTQMDSARASAEEGAYRGGLEIETQAL